VLVLLIWCECRVASRALVVGCKGAEYSKSVLRLIAADRDALFRDSFVCCF